MITSLHVRKFIETDEYQQYFNEFIETFGFKVKNELSSQECNILADALNTTSLNLDIIKAKIETDKPFIFQYGKVIMDNFIASVENFLGVSPTCLIYFAISIGFLEQSEKALADHYKARKYKPFKSMAKEDFVIFTALKSHLNNGLDEF